MHHNRRKSGNTSMTEKTVTATDPSRYGKRPTTLSRRQTPVAAQKLGKSHRDREREWQDSWDDDRESFPQFWYVNMICLPLSLLHLGPSFLSLQPGASGCSRHVLDWQSPQQLRPGLRNDLPWLAADGFPLRECCSVTKDAQLGASPITPSSEKPLKPILSFMTITNTPADWLCSSMTCEKQFVPQDVKTLYCSEACRLHDQQSASIGRSHSQVHQSHYPFYAAGNPEPRDIVPRASPSRPNSMHFSPPTTPGATSGAQYSSAISALRSLSIRPPSPPSPTSSHPSSLWPFTKSSAASPSSSYNRSGNGFFPATYDGGYASTGYAYNYSSSGMDRPLPTRRPTGPGYSRPKSIELVTPMVGR